MSLGGSLKGSALCRKLLKDLYFEYTVSGSPSNVAQKLDFANKSEHPSSKQLNSN